MPEDEKIRIKKRLQQYRESGAAFDGAAPEDRYYQEKMTIGSLLDFLTDRIDALSPYDRTGTEKQIPPPPLTEQQMIQLNQIYIQLKEEMKDLNERMLREADTANRRRKEQLKREYEQNVKLYAILTKDHATMEKALLNTREKNRNYSIRNVFEASRVNSGYNVKQNSVRITASGALSQRIPLTLTSGDKEDQGYFTVDKKTKEGIPGPRELGKLLKKYKSLSFLKEEYIRQLLFNGKLYRIRLFST